ncbi:hypothetical protein ASD43_16105 [Microbacterium sp. Root553]|nr:hypothetical protein ASD43_16105 [Microbacterium sp. Root553]
MSHPLSRIVAAGIAGALIIAAAGCSPGPSPAPTPTPAFTDEADAFAAAEKVYRAYNDALNARRQGDVTADPQQYLTGAALEGDIETQSLLASNQLRAAGTAVLITFAGESTNVDEGNGTVTGTVCVDASGVVLLTATGEDVTPPGRGEKIAQRITFAGTSDTLLISAEETGEGGSC